MLLTVAYVEQKGFFFLFERFIYLFIVDHDLCVISK